MASYPKDRFDELPDDLQRVGAHRGPKRKGRGWVAFAWALLATGVIIFAGLFGLSRYLGDDLGLPFLAQPSTPTPTPTPTPTMDPILDPNAADFVARNITVSVLNGTPTPEVQTTVASALTALGWKVTGAVPAADKDIEETLVYYSDPLNEDAARGVAVALGGDVGIRLVSADTFPAASLTVVIGSDYQAAGATVG